METTYSSHSIGVGKKYWELSSIDSKLLKKINRFVIYTDINGTEVFLITHSDDVFGYGSNYDGRLGFGHTREVSVKKSSIIIPELCGKGVKEIKCGNSFSVALTQTGQIYTFGSNKYGRTGSGHKDDYQKPTEISVNNQIITAIDCTNWCTYVLTQTGRLYWFGISDWNNKMAYIPTEVTFYSEIRSISCGWDHILVLTDNGKVFCWGHNRTGQLGLGHNDNTEKPQTFKFNANIKQITCGYSHSLLLTTNGKLYFMGYNNSDPSGIWNINNQNIPQLISTEQKEICCYRDISMSLDINNRLYVWGNINRGLVSPVLTEFSSFQEIVDNYAVLRSTLRPLSLDLILKPTNNANKTLIKMFNNPNNSDLTFKVKSKDNYEFKDIYCQKCFIKETTDYFQTMFSKDWSESKTNEIIITDYSYEAYYLYLESLYTDSIDSEDMEELQEILSITDKYFDSDRKNKCIELIKNETNIKNVCSVYWTAIKFNSNSLRDYALKIMSDNEEDLIGTYDYLRIRNVQRMHFNETNKFDIFSEISEEFKQNIKLFHVFYDWERQNVFFVTKDDKVFAFGSNSYGILGFGHKKRVNTPTEIPELNGKQIKQFFIGNYFVLALNEENHVFGWGSNCEGQLGRGYNSGLKYYQRPLVILNLENTIEISCGCAHSLALNRDGNVFSWGLNMSGQVGCPISGRSIATPVKLNQLPQIKSIYCSGNRSFAVTFDGLVYSWGDNYYYCLGHEISSGTPQLIIGLNNVISIGWSYKPFGYELTYFLTNEGNVYFCGKMSYEKKEYQKIPKILETDLKFKSLQTIQYFNSKLLALSEETVYCLEKDSIEKTKYKTFFYYCLNEIQNTYKTIEISCTDRFEIVSYRQCDDLGTINSDKFEKLNIIGEGSFGIVLKVKCISDQSLYALKIIELEMDKSDQLFKSVELISKYNSEYVVKYYNHWIDQDQFYIQMELCSNNLANIIEEKRKCFERQSAEEMTETEYFISSHLMKELLECVQYLHESEPPIVHRNLKPQNILVNYQTNNGRFLKLCDFGLTTFGTDSIEGSADDMNEAEFSTKADILSLGQIVCDLFDFDINSSDNRIEKSDDLKQNWTELKKMAINMKNVVHKDRPNCTELLSSFNDWAVIEISEELKNSDSFERNINKIKEFENKFFINYFNAKNQLLMSSSNQENPSIKKRKIDYSDQ